MHLTSYLFDTGFVYNAFFGIPFAVIPGRFMRSVYPHPTWTDVFNANQFPNDCWQLEVGFPQPPAAKSEDCLGINVYVPQCTGCWGYVHKNLSYKNIFN